MRIDTISTIAISIGSFLIGGSLGLILSDCDAVEDLEEETVEIDEEIEEDSIIAINEDIYDEYKDISSKYYIRETLSEGDTDEDRPEPYVVSRDSYENEYLDFHKNSLVYFTEDDTLCDDHDEIIDDVDHILGPEALKSFGEGSDDEDIVYVRNIRMQCDFEIVREHMSYRENVLGISDNSEEYLEARKFFGLSEKPERS